MAQTGGRRFPACGTSRIGSIRGACKARQKEVQNLSDWLLPHRHRGSADSGRKALPLRGDRPHLEVRLRAARRKANRATASDFLTALIKLVPYKIHTVLTDNGIQFRLPAPYADHPTARFSTHMFGMRCQENGIEHRCTKINQVERIDRTIKEATVKRYHSDEHGQLRRHLAGFLNAYNFRRGLKTLKGLTPIRSMCQCWTSQPERFIMDPLQQMPGLNT